MHAATVSIAASPTARIRVAVVNRFFPPDPSPTGIAAAELIAALRPLLPHAEFRAFTTSAAYHGADAPSEAVAVERIGSIYAGRRRVARLAASLYDGRRLAERACRWADCVVSLTDPPLLGYWMGMAARRHGCGWVEWTMDIYPEAFAAAGLVSENNPLYRRIDRAMKRLRPDGLICLGPRQRAWLRQRRAADIEAVVLPTGRLDPPRQLSAPAGRATDDRVALVYAGNLGEAHSPSAVRALVERADPARFRFVLAPYGAGADALRPLAARANVEWRARASDDELTAADVHIVSLRAGWTHVCVPSKAVSAAGYGRPILFLGSPESDSWADFADAGWLVPELPDGTLLESALLAALADIGRDASRAARTAAAEAVRERLLRRRDDAHAEIAAWIAASAARRRRAARVQTDSSTSSAQTTASSESGVPRGSLVRARRPSRAGSSFGASP